MRLEREKLRLCSTIWRLTTKVVILCDTRLALHRKIGAKNPGVWVRNTPSKTIKTFCAADRVSGVPASWPDRSKLRFQPHHRLWNTAQIKQRGPGLHFRPDGLVHHLHEVEPLWEPLCGGPLGGPGRRLTTRCGAKGAPVTFRDVTIGGRLMR